MPNDATVPAIDFSPLAKLGEVYREAQNRRALEELGQKIQSGSFDYNQAAGTLVGMGQIAPGLSLMKAGQGQQASAEFGKNLAGVFGGQSTAGALPGPTSSSPSMAPAGQPDARERQAFEFFTSKGYSPHAAAGITGNLLAESRLDPAALGDSGSSLGIAQWNGPRRQALAQYAQANGGDPNDFHTQLAFVDHELRTTERRAGTALSAATDPASAATAFVGFERPSGWSAQNPSGALGYGRRVGEAQRVASAYGGIPGPDPTGIPPPGARPPVVADARSSAPMQPPVQLAPTPQGTGGPVQMRPATGTPTIGGRPLQDAMPFLMKAATDTRLPESEQKFARDLFVKIIEDNKTPDEVKQYAIALSQGETDTFTNWHRKNRTAGATAITNDMRGENAFSATLGTAAGKRWDKYISEGQQAHDHLTDLNQMREISRRMGSQGAAANWKETLGPYAEAVGVNIEGLSDIQAFSSIVQRLAPQQRVEGSGSTSDIEFKGMLKGMPQLFNNPAAREAILDTMEALKRQDVSRGEIASRLATQEITRAQAEKELRSLSDPMLRFREWRNANRAEFGAALKNARDGGNSASATSGSPSIGGGAAVTTSGLPSLSRGGARPPQGEPPEGVPTTAPDGDTYIRRGGQYFRVTQ
jgi:hypothetical protein